MIYLITGESNQLIKEYLQDIIVGCENIIYIDYHNSSIDEILAEASYYSMFNEEKIIVVKNADCFSIEKPNEDTTKKLVNYYQNPNTLTKLIFTVNGKVDTRRKITKEITENYTFVELPTLKGRELLKKIKERLINSGYEISDDSLYYIINNNANNYDLVYNEIDKLMLYYNKPTKILYDDVINIVARSLDTNNFKFVDAVTAKDIKDAFKMLNDLKLMKAEALSLIGLLAREYRLMLFVKILKEEHYTSFDICKELNLKDWQLEKLSRISLKYKKHELENRLLDLSYLDLNIKSGKIDKWLGLSKFIVDSAE